jgi:hypothetical protein
MVNLKHFILESEASSVKDEEQRMNNGAPLRQPANVQHLQKTFMGEATPTAARPMPPQEWVNQRTLQRQCPPHSECNHPEAELIVVFMPSDTSAVSSPPARPSSLQNGPGRGPQPPHVHVMVLCRPGLSARPLHSAPDCLAFPPRKRIGSFGDIAHKSQCSFCLPDPSVVSLLQGFCSRIC